MGCKGADELEWAERMMLYDFQIAMWILAEWTGN